MVCSSSGGAVVLIVFPRDVLPGRGFGGKAILPERSGLRTEKRGVVSFYTDGALALCVDWAATPQFLHARPSHASGLRSTSLRNLPVLSEEDAHHRPGHRSHASDQ